MARIFNFDTGSERAGNSIEYNQYIRGIGEELNLLEPSPLRDLLVARFNESHIRQRDYTRSMGYGLGNSTENGSNLSSGMSIFSEISSWFQGIPSMAESTFDQAANLGIDLSGVDVGIFRIKAGFRRRYLATFTRYIDPSSGRKEISYILWREVKGHKNGFISQAIAKRGDIPNSADVKAQISRKADFLSKGRRSGKDITMSEHFIRSADFAAVKDRRDEQRRAKLEQQRRIAEYEAEREKDRARRELESRIANFNYLWGSISTALSIPERTPLSITLSSIKSRLLEGLKNKPHTVIAVVGALAQLTDRAKELGDSTAKFYKIEAPIKSTSLGSIFGMQDEQGTATITFIMLNGKVVVASYNKKRNSGEDDELAYRDVYNAYSGDRAIQSLVEKWVARVSGKTYVGQSGAYETLSNAKIDSSILNALFPDKTRSSRTHYSPPGYDPGNQSFDEFFEILFGRRPNTGSAGSGRSSESAGARARADEQARQAKLAHEAELNKAYNLLGLRKGATEDEINKTFRSLSRKYHPDVNKEKGATQKFVDLGNARNLLIKELNSPS